MPRLNTKKAAVINEEQVDQKAADLYAMSESIQQILRSDYGIEDYPQPEGLPEPLSNLDVSELSNTALGSLYSQYVAYSVFLNSKLTDIQCHLKAAKIVLKNLTASLRLQFLADGTKKDEIVAKTRAHPKFEEVEIEALRLEIMSDKVEALAKGYRDQAVALSRNIEIRKLEFEQQQRDGHVQKTKGAAVVAGDSNRRRTGFGKGRTVRNPG